MKLDSFEVLALGYSQCEVKTYPSPEVGLLNKRSCLAQTLSVTKVITIISINSVTLFVLLKSAIDVLKNIHLRPKVSLPGPYWSTDAASGLYYKCFMIVIYNRNDIGLYYKT